MSTGGCSVQWGKNLNIPSSPEAMVRSGQKDTEASITS